MFSAGVIAESQSISIQFEMALMPSKWSGNVYGSALTLDWETFIGVFFNNLDGAIQGYTADQAKDHVNDTTSTVYQPWYMKLPGIDYQGNPTDLVDCKVGIIRSTKYSAQGDGILLTISTNSNDANSNLNVSTTAPDSANSLPAIGKTSFKGISTDLGFLPANDSNTALTYYVNDAGLLANYDNATNYVHGPDGNNGKWRSNTFQWLASDGFDNIIGSSNVGAYRTLEIVL